MVNFLACLGWNDGSEQEIFTMDELIDKFSLARVQHSGARFDEKRLTWLNGQWIKRLSPDDLLDRCTGFWGKVGQSATKEQRREVLSVVQDRLKTLADLPELSEYFFARPAVNLAMLSTSKQLAKLKNDDLAKLLQLAIARLNEIDFTDQDAIQDSLNQLLAEANEKPPVMFGLIRFALTWAKFSPGLPETMLLLGKDETIARLQLASRALSVSRA